MKLRLPWLSLSGALIAGGMSLSPHLSDSCEWNRLALSHGEVWRLVTGHFTHWTANHLVWDAVTFIACAAIIEQHSRRGLLMIFLGAAIAVSTALLLCTPDLARYRGLSGVDSALFVSAACLGLRDARAAMAPRLVALMVAALFGFALKTLAELATGQAFFVAADPVSTPVPLAHLVGGAVGALAFWWTSRGRRWLNRLSAPSRVHASPAVRPLDPV